MKILNVTISGEQGVGKTQLAAFLAAHLRGMNVPAMVEDDGSYAEQPLPPVPTLSLPGDTSVIIRVEELE